MTINPSGFDGGLTRADIERIRGKDLRPVPVPAGHKRPKEKQS